MKRFVILLLIPLFALSSRAEQKVTVGLLNYGLNSETKTATVVGCVVTGGNFSISIPSSVTYSGTTYNVKNIGNSAFSRCVGLTGITIPQTITSIGVSAFNGCSGLTSISIPRSVTTIGSYAFYNCTNLKDIYVYWTAFYAFQGFDFGSFIVSNYKNVNLHVPLGYESIYQQTEPWSLFYIAPTHILATSIKLDRTSLTFTSKYESVQLHVTFNPKNVTNTTLTWTSSNTAVAIVNNGFVTAVGNGTATITARTTDGSNKSATCPVTVDISTAVLATSINLDRTSLTLTSAGQTATLNATISPSNATNKTVSWASSNPAVATVNNGVVTAVGNGTATITARTTDGSNKSATCSVTVNFPIKATGVTLNQTSLTLVSIGQTYTLHETVLPSNATNKRVSWKSSNPTVATVDGGLVRAVANGTTTVTVTTADGSNKTATCEVMVNIPIKVTGVSLNQTSLTLTVGDTATLIATVSPDRATDKRVTWTSSNTEVAAVNSSGVVTAIANGTAIITAEATDGSGLSATCEVMVNIPIKVTGVSLNQTSLTLTVGDTATLIATVSPDRATDKRVTWTSSNTEVAAVNSSGVVTAIANGTAIITAEATDGSGLSATCVVTVTSKIISMIGNPIKSVSEINANSYYLLTSVGRHGSDGRYLCEVDNDPRFEIVTVGHSANAAFQFEIVDDTHFRIRTITGNYFPESGGSNGWFATSMENPATFFIEPILGAEGQFTLQYTDATSMYLDANPASISRWPIKSSANGNGAYRIVPVTLTVQEDVPVLATGVTLNEHSLTLTNIGDTVTLIATVSPDSTTDKTVVWTSSNTKVATVNNNGVVTAVANGTATITVTTADGTNKTATCEVTVDDTSTGGIPGDVNGDGKVNGADVVAVINYVLAASTASDGDVNGDGKVNGADIVATINYVLSFTGTRAYEENIPTETRRLETMFDYGNLSATANAEGISLAMEGGDDYTAFQFIMTLPEKTRLKGVVADENRIGSHSLIYSEMADGRYLVLGYENGNRTIVGTSGTLLKLFVDNFESGMATISDVKFFTPQAETYKLRDVSIDLATGVGYISSDMTNGDVYDAHGRRVMIAKDYEKRKQNLPAGFYIRNGRKFIVR